AFDPDTKCLLAGLVDVVPELAKPGKAQGVVGDVPRPVIDHEDEPAGQQQQSHQTEKAADHASPTISRAQIRCLPLAARRGKFNLASTLSAFPGPGGGRKALTLSHPASIRPPNWRRAQSRRPVLLSVATRIGFRRGVLDRAP